MGTGWLGKKKREKRIRGEEIKKMEVTNVEGDESHRPIIRTKGVTEKLDRKGKGRGSPNGEGEVGVREEEPKGEKG